MALTESAIVASIASAVTMLVPKVLDYLGLWKKLSVDESTSIRQELRVEVTALKAQIAAVYKELDEWRDKYYKLMEENNTLKAENQKLHDEVQDLKDDLGRVKDKAIKLEQKVDDGNVAQAA
jgi:predicted nuclease with TOPRIM domain